MSTLVALQKMPITSAGTSQTVRPWASSSTASKDAIDWDQRVRRVARLSPSIEPTERVRGKDSLERDLFEKLSILAVDMSRIAMHLDAKWRGGLFKQLQSILSEEEWEAEDKLPESGSFLTFLRLITFLKFTVRPGIGVSVGGNIVASWTREKDRFTIECFPADKIRWIISREIDGDIDTAAGNTKITRLHDVITSFGYSWLIDGQV